MQLLSVQCVKYLPAICILLMRGLCFCVRHAFQVMKLVRFLIKIYARLANSSVNLLLYHGFSTNALPFVSISIHICQNRFMGKFCSCFFYRIMYKTDYFCFSQLPLSFCMLKLFGDIKHSPAS